MIVMLVLDLVAGDAVLEAPLDGEPGIAQELERAVDRRVPDAGW